MRTALCIALALSLPAVAPATALQRLHTGATVQGELAQGDDQLQSGEYTDAYEIEGRAGQPLLVTMQSGDFDAYLMIQGPGGYDYQNDDDGEGGTDAALNVTLPADGSYTILATSYGPGEHGRYNLAVLGRGDRVGSSNPAPDPGPSDQPPDPLPPTPALPPAGSRPSQDSLRLLEAHNLERRRVGAPELIWSDSLADDARVWARHLIRTGAFDHDPNRVNQGENLWAGGGRVYSPEEMVGLWIDERVDYQPGVFPNVSRTGTWADVGHYTQLIWRTTTHLGCAIEGNTDRSVLVCRYGPSGNVRGSRP